MRTIDKINYYLTKENKNGADLCEYLGVSSGVYSQWNTGRTHPRKSKLPIIAEYLGVEVSDIQGDDTNKKEKPTAQGGELTEKDVALINMKPLTEEQKQQAMDIAKRIDICVKESGMKKTEFYEKSGISSANFNYWSHGTNYPRQKKLADAAKCLNVSVQYLEYGDEQTKKPHRTRRWAYIRFARKHSKTHFYLLAEPGFYCFAIRSCAADAKSAS